MSRGLKIKRHVAIFVGIAICLVGGGFLLLFSFINNNLKENNKIIPEIKIILNGATLDEINGGPKRVEYIGNEMFLIDGDDERYFDNVEIRGRGNASWLMNKKSYRIKLSRKTDLLKLKKIRKWAMISNNTDNSLMRNDLGYYVANLLYDNYPIQGEFVKFIVDEKDLGLYYMSRLITIDKNSVDLKNSLGILVEVDNVYYEAEENYGTTKLFDHITVEDVVVEDNIDEALNLFINDYNELEKAIIRGDYKTVVEKVDIVSFAKYYLLSEISSNPDAYVTSWYLYKDGEGDKIHANIGWDFDGAFGNQNWGIKEGELHSPVRLMARAKTLTDGWDDYGEGVSRCELLYETLVSPTMCYMVDMPEFRDLVKKTYREKLMGKRGEIISYIRSTADYIRDEAIADNELWGKGNFDEEIEYLIWWVNKRFDYFDELFGWGWPVPIEL